MLKNPILPKAFSKDLNYCLNSPVRQGLEPIIDALKRLIFEFLSIIF